MAEHYYSEEQTSDLNQRKIRARLRGTELEFWTGTGIFSKKKVDKGSEILANKCIISENWRVLDLGCGYGAVGIAVAKSIPSLEVVMTDINKRAVMLAKMNIKLNRVKNISAVQGDMYESVSGNFDTILLNPPQTAGREVCIKMFRLAKEYLKEGGILQIVARHKKGGRTLSEHMNAIFGNVEEVSKGSGYRIYASRN